MVVYASANRDERKFDNPHRFDVTRARADHVGFGYGIHACAGMHLARLEMNSLLSALVTRVSLVANTNASARTPPTAVCNSWRYARACASIEPEMSQMKTTRRGRERRRRRICSTGSPALRCARRSVARRSSCGP